MSELPIDRTVPTVSGYKSTDFTIAQNTESRIGVPQEKPTSALDNNVQIGGVAIGAAVMGSVITKWVEKIGLIILSAKQTKGEMDAQITKSQAELELEKERDQSNFHLEQARNSAKIVADITQLSLAKNFDYLMQLQDIVYTQQGLLGDLTKAIDVNSKNTSEQLDRIEKSIELVKHQIMNIYKFLEMEIKENN
ncbi:hypothetical protein [Pseudanabaena sp. 'Roaring Creek']|uniref:hypothetical protein n=1 Tax=Pseudanabaena sp. 'Roaring Creek' TaxID=1681830 RepID=UPI0006D80E3D|nr:hypothetical protein [Pseudanabaena sp. 'Roaring Creek']